MLLLAVGHTDGLACAYSACSCLLEQHVSTRVLWQVHHRLSGMAAVENPPPQGAVTIDDDDLD